MCNYSAEQAKPGMHYSQWGRGVVLNPGDRLIFQATPQWNSGGTGLYAVSTVTFAAVGSSVPMMRVRFPAWDSGYNVSGGPLLIPAGCDAGCAIHPSKIPPQMITPGESPSEYPSSNNWYVSPVHTAIRGITIFANTSVSGYVRVVQQGGQNISTPYFFTLGSPLGPSAFNQAFGAEQNGSSYVPLDIDVPAGALIGIDFTLQSSGDFGGYLWLDQRPM
jgi:hypothetical protein